MYIIQTTVLINNVERAWYLSGNSSAPELTARVKVRVSVNDNNSGGGELTDKYRGLNTDINNACRQNVLGSTVLSSNTKKLNQTIRMMAISAGYMLRKIEKRNVR